LLLTQVEGRSMGRAGTIDRRSFVRHVAGGVAVAGGAFAMLSGAAQADPPGASHPPSPQDSDRDPGDPSGLGRTIGRDGSDPLRRIARPTVNSGGSRVTIRCTDRDPGDRIGHGIRCRSALLRLTDRDPTDRPGHGRGR
jgi:hypothetical protein